MKKYVSKMIALVCVLSMMLTFALPASAAEMRANGISYGSVVINGVTYDAQFYLGGGHESGGYSGFYTAARCTREHKAVTVVFRTAEAGNQQYSGGARPTITGKNGIGVTGTTESYRCRYGGADTPIGVLSMSATLVAKTYGGNDYQTVETFNFYASAR